MIKKFKNNYSNVDDMDEIEEPNQIVKKIDKSLKGKYFIINKELHFWKHDSENPFKIGKAVEIIEIQNNIENQEQKIRLSFVKKDNTVIEADITRDELDPEKFKRLLKLGMDIVGKKILHVISFLDQQEAEANVVNIHKGIGWATIENKLIFKHAEAIGCNSIYDGSLNIIPKGSLDGWKNIVEEMVLGHIPLELSTVIGLSAPIVSLLRNKTLIDVLLFHQYGNSTEGKTTAARLAVSSAGYPHTKDNGLIKTFAGTPNAMIGNLRGNYGLPIALDESSIQNGEDFTKFIYTVVNGRDKDRMNSNGELRVTSEYSTTVISNGEHSLIEKSNQNIGLK